jgi:hypothetical protein
MTNETGPMDRGLRSSEPKSAVAAALGIHLQSQERSDAGLNGRVIVQITRCSTGILDADNLAGSVKFILDALRSAKLIPGDDPASIELKVSQIKVARRKEIGTHVRIISK